MARFPVFNFVWFCFGDDEPSTAEVAEGLNTMALVSALTFAVAGSLPTAVSLEECLRSDKAFWNAPNGQYVPAREARAQRSLRYIAHDQCSKKHKLNPTCSRVLDPNVLCRHARLCASARRLHD